MSGAAEPQDDFQDDDDSSDAILQKPYRIGGICSRTQVVLVDSTLYYDAVGAEYIEGEGD
jgi:hypothetical protein